MTSDVTVTPRTPTLGATITGVNGKQRVDDAVIDTIRAVLLEYKVVFLPDQHLTEEEQYAFASRFGEPSVVKRRLPDTTYLRDPGMSKLTVVEHFHSDDMFMSAHPQNAMLTMLEVPEVGGDTMWADQVAAYEALSAPFRAFLDTLTAIHGHPDYYADDASLQRRYGGGQELPAEELRDIRASLAPNEHPLIRYIPGTGRKSLWCSPRHTRAIKDLTPDESDALLKLLFSLQIRPQHVVRYEWSVGDVAIWDHRTTLHAGIRDYGDGRRKGRRVNIGSSTPIAAPAGS